MKIVIVSYGRADKVITRRWLSRADLIVPESQREAYEKNYKRVVSIPDELDGNIAKKRNAVLDLHKGDDVVMIDDDIKSVGYNEERAPFHLTEKRLVEFCLMAFRMAREIGTVLWGLNPNEDPVNYNIYCPFNLTSCILGPFLGITKENELRFAEDLATKEDYDFSLQVLQKHRKVLRFNKYFYVGLHTLNKGGIVSQRTMESDLSVNKRLQEKWGSSIVILDRKTHTPKRNKTINPSVRPPIKGV